MQNKYILHEIISNINTILNKKLTLELGIINNNYLLTIEDPDNKIINLDGMNISKGCTFKMQSNIKHISYEEFQLKAIDTLLNLYIKSK